ncbi:hypothetical protein [Falsiroseomonas sp.]|uniref:hypothetical protein n=1 Tax=Falsiroseomonas sp. TaxID=2870721 RepID=UPI0027200F76|nr:hypothetical protein [Falsiroseomonas sp.]MDO9499014.1 hypothetical protein [Falsiroseomonas sp.]
MNERNPLTQAMAEAMMQVSKGHAGLVVAEAVMQAALSIISNCVWPDHVPELLRNSGDYLHQAADRLENQQAQQPVVMQ